MAERTVRLIEADGGEAVAVETDLMDDDDAAALADTIEERFDRLDVRVNNAGIRVEAGPVTDVDTESIERIVDVRDRRAHRGREGDIRHHSVIHIVRTFETSLSTRFERGTERE